MSRTYALDWEEQAIRSALSGNTDDIWNAVLLIGYNADSNKPGTKEDASKYLAEAHDAVTILGQRAQKQLHDQLPSRIAANTQSMPHLSDSSRRAYVTAQILFDCLWTEHTFHSALHKWKLNDILQSHAKQNNNYVGNCTARTSLFNIIAEQVGLQTGCRTRGKHIMTDAYLVDSSTPTGVDLCQTNEFFGETREEFLEKNPHLPPSAFEECSYNNLQLIRGAIEWRQWVEPRNPPRTYQKNYDRDERLRKMLNDSALKI